MPYEPRRRAPHRRPLPRRRRAWRISPGRARRTRGVGAAVLATVAITCAGYLTWEFVGTNVVARHQQHRALAALTSAWERQAPSITKDGVAVDGILRIPRFGSAYAVPLVEGTGPRSLALGVGHVVGSAHAGGTGNVVVAGHRVTHGEPFRRLPSLQIGDDVIIDTIDAEYVYRVTSGGSGSLRLRDNASWVLAASPRNPDPGATEPPRAGRLITLLTCAELFHTSDRFVVFGELVRTRPRTHAHTEA